MNRPLVNKALAVGLLVAVSFAAFLARVHVLPQGRLLGEGHLRGPRLLPRRDRPHAGRAGCRSRASPSARSRPSRSTAAAPGSRCASRTRSTSARTPASRSASRRRSCRTRCSTPRPGRPPRRRCDRSRWSSAQITCVKEAVSVEALLDSLSKIAEDIQVVSGELVADRRRRRRGASRTSSRTSIGCRPRSPRPPRTARASSRRSSTTRRAFTGTLREVTERDRERYHSIARNVEDASARLVALLEQVQGIVGDEEGDVEEVGRGRPPVAREAEPQHGRGREGRRPDRAGQGRRRQAPRRRAARREGRDLDRGGQRLLRQAHEA